MIIVSHLILGLLHLSFTAMDLLMVMILIKVSHDRWHPSWLKPFAKMVAPALESITHPLSTWLTQKTGKVYSEKSRLLLLVFGLSLVRLVICSLI